MSPGLAQPEEVHTILVSDGVLQTLGVPPAIGRWFSQADQEPRGAKTIILSTAIGSVGLPVIVM